MLPTASQPLSSYRAFVMNKKPIYCWDSTVLIAWIDEEVGAPLADIDLVATAIDRKEAALLLSVTAYMEILRVKHTPEQMDKFRSFASRSNVEVANVTIPIANLVEEIRSNGLSANPKRSIKTPD